MSNFRWTQSTKRYFELLAVGWRCRFSVNRHIRVFTSAFCLSPLEHTRFHIKFGAKNLSLQHTRIYSFLKILSSVPTWRLCRTVTQWELRDIQHITCAEFEVRKTSDVMVFNWVTTEALKAVNIGVASFNIWCWILVDKYQRHGETSCHHLQCRSEICYRKISVGKDWS